METPSDQTLSQDLGAEMPPPADVDQTPAEDETRPVDYEGQGRKLIERCIADAKNNTARLLRDRADLLAMKFDRGGRDNHWCVWDNGTQRYVPRGEDPDDGGLPSYIPRPVTNTFHSMIKGLTSILDQSEPAQVFAPRTESDKDQATADVAEDAVPVLREECGYDSEGHRHELNRYTTLIDKALYILYYDNSEEWGTKDLETFMCSNPDCGEQVLPLDVEDAGGKCPHCGNPDTASFELFTDPQGMPVGFPMPIGRVRAEVLSSLEFSVPSAARRPHAKAMPWILTHGRMSPEDLSRFYGKDVEELVRDKSTWADGSLTKAYADEMRRLSSPASSDVMGGGAQAPNGPVVYRLYHDPIDDHEFYFPDGFYGVMVGDKLLEPGPLPFKDSEGRPFKNTLIRTFEGGLGNAFGHPPSDDLIPIQQSRNLTEAMIELIIMHDAAPTTYVPDSVSFIDEPSGIPGEYVRYRSIDGQKPTSSRGQNPPEALFQRLDNLDEKMQEISGLNSVLLGQRPQGDPTLGEVQILDERGKATFAAPLDSLVTFEKDLSFQLLEIARQCAWSPRFRRIKGENGQWELKQFAAADLTGQVDITVDRASAWPRSPLMEQLRLKEALSMGALMPPAQDPELQGKVLMMLNLSKLKPSWDADRRQVARELERWKAATTPQEILERQPNPLTQNLQIHLYLKQQFMKTEEADQLFEQNQPVWAAMVSHIQQIQMAMMPPAPAPPPETGSKGTLDQAIADKQLVPDDGAAGHGAVLDQALAGGQLEPVAEGPGGEPLPPSTEQAPPGSPMMPAAPMPSIDQLLAAELQEPLPPPPGISGPTV